MERNREQMRGEGGREKKRIGEGRKGDVIRGRMRVKGEKSRGEERRKEKQRGEEKRINLNW